MRDDWSPLALDQLQAIARRAPLGAARVIESVQALAASPFPHMFRRVAEHPYDHVLVVPPYLVVYTIIRGRLTVVQILDGRTLGHPL